MSNYPSDDPSGDVKRVFSQYWTSRSESFDSQPQHISQSDEETDAWKNILGMLTSGREGLRVLEVGTGTGFLAFLLSEMGHRVTGTDMSTGMLAQAREKAGVLGRTVLFEEGDAERTRFPDDTFDLVVSRHVLWNLPNPDVAILEWVRVTKPGGVVGVIDGSFSTPGDHWGEPYKSAFEQLPSMGGEEPEQVEALMAQEGLVSIRTEWLDTLVSIKKRTIPDYSSSRWVMSGTKPVWTDA